MFDNIAEDKPEQIYLQVLFFLFFISYVHKNTTLNTLFFTQLYCINLIVYSMYHKQAEFLMESII